MSNEQREPTFEEIWNAHGAPAATEPAATEPAQPAATGDEPGEQTPPAGEGEQQPAAPAAAATAEDFSWVAALPPEVQEKVNRIKEERAAAQSRYDALHGKVAPTQRALAQANSQLANLRSQIAAQPAAQATSTEDSSYFDSEEWKQYAEAFPGDAKVIAAAIKQGRAADANRIAQLERMVAEQGSVVASTQRVAADVELGRNIQELSARHADWEDINKSEAFWDWFDGYRAAMPEEVRDAFYDPPTLDRWFATAKFTGDMITRFKADTGYSAPQAQAPAQPATESTPQQPASQSGSARLRMAASPDVRTSGSAPRGAVPLETLSPKEQFDAVWNASNR